MIKAMISALESAARILIVSHRDPDGDALGSSLGLAHLLLGQGKEVFVHSAGPVPPEYEFLPGIEMVTTALPEDDWADLAVLLDCHQPSRAGKAAAEFLPGVARSVIIDHHEGPVDFGDPVWVDPSMAATSQMVALLAGEADWALSPDAATNLFVGVQTDTGRFQYSNTTPLVFMVAATLVEAGASPWPSPIRERGFLATASSPALHAGED
jgi:phosphoesterase RecJ-like protein